MEQKYKKFTRILGIICLVLLTIFLFKLNFSKQINLIISAFLKVFTPMLIALFISYLLEPLVNIFHDKFRIKQKWICVSLTLLFLLIFVSGFIIIFSNFIFNQIIIFVSEDFSLMIHYLLGLIEDNELLGMVKSYFSFEKMQPILINALTIMDSLFEVLSGIILNIVLIPIFLFFFLSDRNKIFKSIANFLPEKTKVHALEIGRRSNKVVHSYFRGKLTSMVFIFIYFTICFSVIGLSKYALLFALILTVLDLIPYVGPFIGIFVPMLYAFIFKETLPFKIWTPVIIFAINAVGQWLQNNVIIPLIIGKEMNINPLLILISMLFFGEILGIWGIILAIPICGCIKVIYVYFAEINNKTEKKDKKMDEVISEEL